MNTKELLRNINKYKSYMEEIKRRTDVAKKVVDLRRQGISLTGDIESDIDLIYLQLRKITELVMFACVVARKTAGDRLNRILLKGYEVGKLRKELNNLNVEYFPTPKYDREPQEEDLRSIGNLADTGATFASEDTLLSAYGYAGNYLHAQRESKYGDSNTKKKILNRAIDDLTDIVTLLNHHWIKISDDVYFAVVMHGESDGQVQVTQLEKVPNEST